MGQRMKAKSVNRSVVGGLGIAGAGMAVLMTMLMTQVPGCGCADSGKAFVSSLAVMQQALYFETGAFSDDKAVIARELGQDWSENERYQMEVKVADNVAYAFATPHTSTFHPKIGLIKGPEKPYFTSKVSAIVAIKSGQNPQAFSRIVCVAQAPTDSPLEKPEFDGAKFTCPANSQEIK